MKKTKIKKDLSNKLKEIGSENKVRGITLIALIVTIVILIILAGVTINVIFGQKGIINQVKQATIDYKKSQYFEEINLEILEEQMERKIEKKDELFITSIEHRIGGTPIASISSIKTYAKKDWVDNVINKSDKILIINTKEHYQIIIDFDNENNTATIREDSFGEIRENYIITYKANGGSGKMTDTSIGIGETQNLPENKFTRDGFIFIGWKDQNNNTYSDKQEIEPKSDLTLTAQWDDTTPPTVTITMSNSDQYLFAIKSVVTISDAAGIDPERCKYIYTDSKTPVGDDISLYTDGSITQENATINKMKSAGTYYLHVLATDGSGNPIEAVSDKAITIASVVNFDYATDAQGNGKEQTTTLLPGSYKLECWGAQGGTYCNTNNNYGGFSVGVYSPSEATTIFINVGGQGSYFAGTRVNYPWNATGSDNKPAPGGYNGGGDGFVSSNDQFANGGGGATHIATVSGQLKDLSTYKDTAGTNSSNEILIVAGGGGSCFGWKSGTRWNGVISGGGFQSNSANGSCSGNGYAVHNASGATQNTGNAFGLGTSSGSGGGGGWYGGYSAGEIATGGSGYINCPALTNKYMTAYSVTTSNSESTKTNTTTAVSSSAESNKAKSGSGYARITNMN